MVDKFNQLASKDAKVGPQFDTFLFAGTAIVEKF